jgi:hypothetical protein
MVAGLALLGAHPAWGAASQTPGPVDWIEPAPRGWLELRGGLGLRADRLSAVGENVSASGSAVSDLVAAGAWFAGARPIGIAARLEMERFSVKNELGPPMGPALGMFGLDVAAGATGRLSGARGRLTLEGMLGYAFVRVPLAGDNPSGDRTMPLQATPVSAHGPTAAAMVSFAALDGLALEAGARALPLTFGGQRAAHAMPLRRFAVDAGAAVGRFDRAGLRWSALVLYELGSTTVDTTAVNLTQTRHQISVGLRATFRTASPIPSAIALEPAGDHGRIAGLVRAAPAIEGDAPGPPLADVIISVAGKPVAKTDAAGAFTIDALPAGLVRLRVDRAGLRPVEEVVSVPAEGEARLEVTLEIAGGPVPATLVGLVRDDDGAPIVAQVQIVERRLKLVADERGRFRVALPPGRYTVIIEAPGFVTQRKMLLAAPGEQNIYNLDLHKER